MYTITHDRKKIVKAEVLQGTKYVLKVSYKYKNKTYQSLRVVSEVFKTVEDAKKAFFL